MVESIKIANFSAERLNLYIDRHEGGLDQTEDDVMPGGVTFQDEPKSSREKWKQV
jgi:hypothetical protein